MVRGQAGNAFDFCLDEKERRVKKLFGIFEAKGCPYSKCIRGRPFASAPDVSPAGKRRFMKSSGRGGSCFVKRFVLLNDGQKIKGALV
jgi:hypothetical protein